MTCISFLGQLKEMMQGQSCGRVTNFNPHRFLYGHIIMMAHNCSWKMSSLRWLMSFLTHLDHSPLPYQQQIGYFEIQRKELQLVLSQHWVKPLGWRDLMFHDHGFWSSGESSTRAFQGDEWVTPDVGKRRQEKSLHATVNYKCYWVTSKDSSGCQRLIANMKKQKGGYSILPMLANMATRLWRFVQITQIFFVMSLMFQYKISVLLIKRFGTKTMVDLLTLQSCGHYCYLGKPIFHIPYSHRISHSIFSGHGKIIIFIFLTSNKEIMDDSHDLDQN